MKILVSGGTGFLGRYLVPSLRQRGEVFVISRGENADIRGDLTSWNGGLDLEELKKHKFDVFVHAAGLYKLGAPTEDLHLQNVSALGTALKIAKKLDIKCFVNTSSVAAGLNSQFAICKPDDLNFSKPFLDYYAESKALGEMVLKNWAGGPEKRLNLRLGVLVGDTKGSAIQRVDGPYHAADSFRKMRGLLEKWPTALILPGSSATRIPIVPVDVAAEAIARLTEYCVGEMSASFQSLHLTPNEGLDLKTLYSDSLKNNLIPLKEIKLFSSFSDKVISKISTSVVKFPKEELDYILNLPRYNNEETNLLLGDNWCPEYKTYQKQFWSGYEKFISNR